jgi:uncharacterized protein (DUF1330 family)
MKEYGQLAGATLSKYGAKVTTKGKVEGVLTGVSDLDLLAIMEFPSIEKIDEWYNSDEYQAAIKTREEACDMTILKIVVP